MLWLVMKHLHHVHKHLFLLLYYFQHKLVISSSFFLLTSKLLLIINIWFLTSSCLFLISSLLNSISCCRIAISDSVFSCKNFSVSEPVFMRFDVHCFSAFSIDFRFIVSPKVSNDFLRMSSAFVASCCFFLLLFHWRFSVFFELLQIALLYLPKQSQNSGSSGSIQLYLSSFRFCFLYVFSNVW